jgi:probable F420-dependent oxidoreductase
MSRFKVGVQLYPQFTTMAALRRAWQAADRLEVDSIWTWDHFFPFSDAWDQLDRGVHFENWSIMAAIAADTTHAHFGTLVTCTSYRSPDLLADMARTIDHISGGRMILGIGAGYSAIDHDAYGLPFDPSAAGRLRRFEADIDRIEARFERLEPPPAHRIPILIGGSGEKVLLRIVAERADAWNFMSATQSDPVGTFARKSAVLDRWCEQARRDPAAVERTVGIDSTEVHLVDGLLQAGAQHLIVGFREPFDLAPIEPLLAAARG